MELNKEQIENLAIALIDFAQTFTITPLRIDTLIGTYDTPLILTLFPVQMKAIANQSQRLNSFSMKSTLHFS
jgi:hypothetical protein